MAALKLQHLSFLKTNKNKNLVERETETETKTEIVARRKTVINGRKGEAEADWRD